MGGELVSTIRFLVDVDVERESGKFAGRDEITDAIQTAMEEGIESAQLDSLGADADSVYNITGQGVEPLDNKRLKALWEQNEKLVVEDILGAKERRELKRKIRELEADVRGLKSALEEKKAEELSERTSIHTESYGVPATNLPDDSNVRFHIGDRVYVDVSIKNDRLELNGSEPLYIKPQSSNYFAIKGAGYGA